MFLLTPGGNAHGLNTLRIKELHHFRRRSIFLPKVAILAPFRAVFRPFGRPISSASGRGQVLSGTQATSVAMLALLTTFGPQPQPARSTSGEPGPAAARPAFASRSYRTARQLVRKRHAGRPGFLVSMSLHPRTALRPGRHAGLFLTPNCQDGSARSQHT